MNIAGPGFESSMDVLEEVIHPDAKSSSEDQARIIKEGQVKLAESTICRTAQILDHILGAYQTYTGFLEDIPKSVHIYLIIDRLMLLITGASAMVRMTLSDAISGIEEPSAKITGDMERCEKSLDILTKLIKNYLLSIAKNQQ